MATTAPLAVVVGCNVHEIGHAVVGSAIGWEVERLHPCAPGGGSVEYAQVGTSFGTVEGYAGGLFAAAVLLAIYVAVFARRRAPLRGPAWWATGIGLTLPIGVQLVIGIVEGIVGPERNYADLFRDRPAVFVPIVVAAALAGSAAYVWRWRAVWWAPGDSNPEPAD